MLCFHYISAWFYFGFGVCGSEGVVEDWLESDSTSALFVLKNASLVSVLLRNWWDNARSLGIHVISSHIFREGNVCADMLASMGHSVDGAVWLSILPSGFQPDFYSDRCSLPRLRFL